MREFRVNRRTVLVPQHLDEVGDEEGAQQRCERQEVEPKSDVEKLVHPVDHSQEFAEEATLLERKVDVVLSGQHVLQLEFVQLVLSVAKILKRWVVQLISFNMGEGLVGGRPSDRVEKLFVNVRFRD